MPAGENLSFTGRLRSVRYALQGIATVLRSQHNAWIHAAATAAVIPLGIVCGLSAGEWCWIVVAVVAVWAAEAMNTAIEFLTDVASPGFHPLAGQAKDAAAGAVLITAAGAVAIGLLVLGPHLYDRFCRAAPAPPPQTTAATTGAGRTA
ncbi:MAG TPA: diacylglycerol kinase family protein [Urbifossiella sp.]|jgi:diacylglycerol kinase (ATP)|nr:diacylglycerol kinase family protein [Urbifossiella sp.]